jgi:hypothetical protein
MNWKDKIKIPTKSGGYFKELENELNLEIMRTKDIELANVLLDVYRIIGLTANGFDRSICSTIDGTKELQMFFDDADDSDVKDLAIYLSSLREHKGWRYSNEICAHLTGVKKFPLLSEHLCLSVYC